PRIEKKSFYKAEDVIPYLKEIQQKLSPEKIRVVILFSGDSGFYSGCQTLYKALWEETENGNLSASMKLMPGISSVAYLASVLGESYEDAAIYSTHGKELPNLIRRLKRESKIFMLLSGAIDLAKLGEMLVKADMNGCEISVGYQLSYPEQSIRTLTPKECCGIREEGLYVCCIKNPYVEQRKLTHGKPDTDFIRDKVPMTKEEIREVSICKLKLHKDAVVYDIGSGTGSIAVEIAGLSDDIQVFAIERNKEAADLIKKNITKFGTENISVVTAAAPEGFSGLPVPTHAFVGGTGGRWKEILSALYRLNPNMRVVLNAVSIETISAMKEISSLYPVANEEVIQIQVNRVKRAGRHHLMQAENPVWICSFNFSKFGEEIQHET
ncbi:MAG: precorrin-6Y C5,15-methyltransferase (decarboxylating) subunit CbiT, partial [Lachnospiraceae bacterium]|nr:precorrin-6Y C5,15-methyltransferase (decarboxylating) subunit CbiT [Lachnospiraceae bacterium]